MTHAEPDRPVVSPEMLERLRDTAAGYTDCFDNILDTQGVSGRYGGVDGREMLINMLSSLIVLTGSEEDAVSWLFYSRGYKAVVGDDICSNVVEGNFWTLAALQVIEAHRDKCPELIDTIFRSRDREAGHRRS
jgi:hypothetical protein